MPKPIVLLLALLTFHSYSFGQKQVLWEESFNNNSRRWLTGSDANYHAEIKNRTYTLRNHQAEGLIPFDTPSLVDPYQDFHIEIRLSLLEGALNTGFGVYMKDVRLSKNIRENIFLICGSGLFYIYTSNPHTHTITDLQKWKTSPAIRKGYNQENILTIKQAGKITLFLINGEKVFEMSNGSFWGNDLGFVVNAGQSVKSSRVLVKQDRGKINLVPGIEKEPVVKENIGSSVNSPYSEIMPVISQDGNILYLDVKDDPANTGSGEKEKDDVWFSTRNADGTWSKRMNIGYPINNSSHNFVISVTPDNNSLVLYGQYDEHGYWKKDGISIAHKTKSGWSIPEDIKIENYYSNSNFTAYCLSPDRKVLIMAVERNDTYGYLDLYVSFHQPDGSWSAPKNMGPTLNTYGYEVAPFIAADGKSLYYSTDGKLGYGSNDIFMSKRLDDTWLNWSSPMNLGPKINTADWDAYYTIPASGDYAYMVSSDNTIGEEDIFRVKVSHTAKPEPVVIIYGKVFSKNTKEPLEADIAYYELNSREAPGTARSNPEDGSYKIVLPYGKAYGFLAEKKNYLSESDHIDLTEIKNYTQIERNLYLSPIEVGKSITLNNVFFERSKAVLLPESKAELDRLADVLKNNPGIHIELSGHTDNIGNPDINLALSEERVKAIQKYLTDKGIDAGRLSGKGYGGTMPVASNDSEASRKLNRRVEFTIVHK